MSVEFDQLNYRRTFVVPCSPEQAFAEFTDPQGGWWPHDHRRGAEPVLGVGYDPHVGGEWFDIQFGGGRVKRGDVLVWEPGRRLVVGWPLNFGQPWNIETQGQSEMEVVFSDFGGGCALVDLEHRDMQRTPNVEFLRKTFFGPYGWDLVVTAFTGYLSILPWPGAKK